jgi:hypothetical protein
MNNKEDYVRDDVKLVVEQQEDSLVIVYANMTAKDTYELAITLIGKLSEITEQAYNGVLEDLKETGE